MKLMKVEQVDLIFKVAEQVICCDFANDVLSRPVPQDLNLDELIFWLRVADLRRQLDRFGYTDDI